MNKLSVIVLMAVVICSCYGMSDHRSIRSASEVTTEASLTVANISAPQDLEAAETKDIFTPRGKKGKNKMEAMHMGLTYIKMVISTLMSSIGHLFAMKSVGLTLISVIIQIAQFIMVLKKNKETQTPSYKIVQTPWHPAPTEAYGAYGPYGAGHGKAADVHASPYMVKRRR